jgi:hypothetical protein
MHPSFFCGRMLPLAEKGAELEQFTGSFCPVFYDSYGG